MNTVKTYIIGIIALTAVLITGLILFRDMIYADTFPFWWTFGGITFLFLYELATILIIDKKSNAISAQKSVNLYLGLKVGKILLSVFFVLIYAVVVKLEMKRFIMVFVLLYFIYLVFNTLYLSSREKEAKKKKLLTQE